jgi:hypothetical protein
MRRVVLDRTDSAPHRRGWRALRTIAGSTVLVYDRYGSYPVRSLICHGTFWKAAVDELLARADLVVLDLSGYRIRNAGTQYELRRIVDTMPIDRVLLLADPRSNKAFLREQIEFAWQDMAASSPNAEKRVSDVVVELAITDYFVEVDQHSAGGASGQTRLELRSSRHQTRWLLDRAQSRIADAPRASFPPTPDPPPSPHPSPPPTPPPPPPPRRTALLVAGVAVALMAAGFVFVWPQPLPLISFDGGTAATVRPGSGYNARAGPSTATAVLEPLPAGTEVLVECLDGNWARLSEPLPGSCVYVDGLVMTAQPAPC